MNLKALTVFSVVFLAGLAAAQEIDYDDVYAHHRREYTEEEYDEMEQQQRRRQPTAAELQQHQASATKQCGPCEKEQCPSPTDCLAGMLNLDLKFETPYEI